MDGPSNITTGAVIVRRIFAVAVAGWLTFASVRATEGALASWPDSSHERGWTTSLAERETLSLGPILPILEALNTHTDPGAIVLAPARADSTELIDIPVNGLLGWARFLALPRMVVVTAPDAWRARSAEIPATDEPWILDLIGATAEDQLGLVEVAAGPGWRLLSIERADGER